MCGFVAATRRDLSVPELPLLAHLAELLDHRGPDDEGYLVDRGIGMYHKRLSIIDPKCGRQPMTLGPYTMVYNGEVYNYVELRQDLERAGHRFRTTSDTEVILRLYAERGDDFVDALNGMFAIVIHDRSRQRVIAVRDRLGIKPLYFAETNDGVVFASEIKALLRHPGIRAQVDRDALGDYLTFQYVLGERTLFAGVHKVLPGRMCSLDIARGTLQHRRYWDLDFRVTEGRDEGELTEELRHLIQDAVRIQMRSDVPVGSHLSGGLDSSVVATLASGHHPRGLHGFHGRFAEGIDFDESAYAREAAVAAGIELHELVPTAEDFVRTMPVLAWHMDEPTAGPGIFPQYMISLLAAKRVKVVLGGQGGDEIFGGYARYLVAYLEQALKGAILETNEEAEHIVSLSSIVPQLPSLRQYLPMMRQFWADGLFGPMDRRYYRLIDRMGSDTSLLTQDTVARLEPESRYARFSAIFNHPDTLSYVNKMTHFDLVTSLPALLQVEDRVSMAASLESRVPLLDHRIVELVAGMPPAVKFRGGELKHAFKRAVGDVVPPRVLQRKDKMGFPVPLHLWARGSLRDFFGDLLLSPIATGRGIFRTSEVEQLLDDEAAFGRKLWGVLNLELWHRMHVDEPQPAVPAASWDRPDRAVTELVST